MNDPIAMPRVRSDEPAPTIGGNVVTTTATDAKNANTQSDASVPSAVRPAITSAAPDRATPADAIAPSEISSEYPRFRRTDAADAASKIFSFWFNNDNNSFNGVWWRGNGTGTPTGRVVGQRSLGG